MGIGTVVHVLNGRKLIVGAHVHMKLVMDGQIANKLLKLQLVHAGA